MAQLKTSWLVWAGVLAGTAWAATTYKAVDLTIKSQMSDGRIGVSPTASPVLGASNPPIKNGVAFAGLSRQMGSYNVTLSPKWPTQLHLDLTQGSLKGSLAGVPLRTLEISSNQTDTELTLPAASFTGSLTTKQGSLTLNVPANVGVQFNLQKFSMGSLSFGSERVVDTLEASGTYATPNYASAQYKIQFVVQSNQTDIKVQTR